MLFCFSPLLLLLSFFFCCFNSMHLNNTSMSLCCAIVNETHYRSTFKEQISAMYFLSLSLSLSFCVLLLPCFYSFFFFFFWFCFSSENEERLCDEEDVIHFRLIERNFLLITQGKKKQIVVLSPVEWGGSLILLSDAVDSINEQIYVVFVCSCFVSPMRNDELKACRHYLVGFWSV